jgi:MFS family permease
LGTKGYVSKVCIALGWILFTWIPHHWYWRTKRPWWFIVAAAKSIIAAAFIPPVYFESKYLPRPLNSCQNEELWPDSNNVPYGSPSMFLLIQGSYGALGDPEKYVSSCEKLLSLWRFQIAMWYVSELFLYLETLVTKDAYSSVLVTVSAISATVIFVFFDRLDFRDEVAEKWSCCA